MLLSLRGIRKAFGATQALAGVDLDLPAGGSLALLGENGAGKSTLIRVLTGVHAPDAGTMLLDGRAWAPRDPLAARRGGLAVVHQELSLAPDLTVAENIVLGAEPARCGVVDRRRRDAIAGAALAEVGAAIDPGARVGDLAPAARQLTEIARAIAAGPRLLVLDEPTSSLGRGDAEALYGVLDRLRARGVALLFISHFLEECRRLCRDFAVLRDGASVAAGELAAHDDGALIRHMVGRAVAELYPRTPHQPGDERLRLDGLRGPRTPPTALTLRAGEIRGIFGLLGAGRTRLLRLIAGLERDAGGRVLLDGAPLPPGAPARLARGVALLSEDRAGEGLLLPLPIADNATLSRLAPVSRLGWIGRRRQHAAADALIGRLGVRARGAAQPVGELSGGNQQKVALARLLHHGCRAALLDEPTRGIDVAAKAVVYRTIGELAAAGCAVLISSSYIPELLGVCDSVQAMRRGVLGEPRAAAEWTPEALLAEAMPQGAERACA